MSNPVRNILVKRKNMSTLPHPIIVILGERGVSGAERDLNTCLLNETGRKTFSKALDA